MDETVDAGVETDELGSELETGVETDDTVSSAESQDNTDWKAIAEAEREKAKNYKNALDQKRQLRTQATPSPEEENDEDAPLTRKDLRSLLREEVVPLVSASKEDTLLSQKITDPSKRDYVRQLLETRIVRTGTSDEDIANDIEAAIAIADSKKKDKTIAELKRAAINKPQAPSAGSSEERPLEQKAYKWTAEQTRALEAKARNLGVDPEKFKKDAWDNQKKTRVNM
jgi:hypothetical protein